MPADVCVRAGSGFNDVCIVSAKYSTRRVFSNDVFCVDHVNFQIVLIKRAIAHRLNIKVLVMRRY